MNIITRKMILKEKSISFRKEASTLSRIKGLDKFIQFLSNSGSTMLHCGARHFFVLKQK